MNGAQRSSTPLLAIAAALVGAPALWFAQMLVSETLASTACYPLGVAQAVPRWAHVGVWLALIAACAFALAAAFATWLARAWRHRHDTDASGATRDDSTRFLARCGMLAALGFVIGLVFTGIVTAFVGPCSPWH
ncbi:cytochrome C oxidase subunit I [Burkholderia contaminans]|uniref:cytochrome C oxidase subunit I n=1 Tax=Burkholderia contaminans TaxID=488447 RepID=UPI003D677F30